MDTLKNKRQKCDIQKSQKYSFRYIIKFVNQQNILRAF